MQKKFVYKKAIILGGSKGIGKSIAQELKKTCKKVYGLSRKDVDTSNLSSVKLFIKKFRETDVLVLNTGGPENIPFDKIS